MKFFHLINVRWHNATSWYALNLCKLLQQSGHEVVAGVIPNTETSEKAHELGLTTIEDKFATKCPYHALLAAKNLNRFLNEFKPDFATAHRGELFWFLALKKAFGAKWKLSRVRGDQRPPKNNFFNRLTHNKICDRLIVSGERIKNIYINDLKTPAEKISVIYGGVDLKKFSFDEKGRAKVRAEFDIKEDEILVGLVGRYSEVKGHKSLIDAIKILRANDPKYKLILVTDSADLNIADLQKYIDELELQNAVYITGFRSDIAACISAFDVGVVASLGSEAICRVAFEIMACGIPLVSTAVGSLPEIAPIANLVPPNDPQALAEKIKNHDKTARIFDENDFLKQYLTAIGAAQ